jgi:hypothetical protein
VVHHAPCDLFLVRTINKEWMKRIDSIYINQ